MEYFLENPELFFVSENNSKISGFCMGYLVDGINFTRRFLRHNYIRIFVKVLWLLLCGKKTVWDKIIFSNHHKADDVKFVDESFKNIGSDQKVDLLSICVVPEFRGLGVSSKLIECFQKAGRERGRKYCVLSVKKDNERGIKFYKKHEYKISKETGEKIFLIREI